MKWSINEIQKKKIIEFKEALDLTANLKARSSEILDAEPVQVTGQVAYDDGLYLLDYELQTVLTLPSSRSLKPVSFPMTVFVNEVFSSVENLKGDVEFVDADLIIPLEKDLISCDESVEDNILLEIPLQILAEDEQSYTDLPTGKFWSVISEDSYEAKKAEQKEEKKSPFASLDGLFD